MNIYAAEKATKWLFSNCNNFTVTGLEGSFTITVDNEVDAVKLVHFIRTNDFAVKSVDIRTGWAIY